MQQPRYKVAKELPFIPIGGELTYDVRDQSYHYGYFAISEVLIGKSSFFEKIEEPDYSQSELFDTLQRTINEVQNKLAHARKQVHSTKHVENVRMIEGIYATACKQLNVYNNIELCCGHEEIYLAIKDTDIVGTKYLRSTLEELTTGELVDVIYNSVKELAAQLK